MLFDNVTDIYISCRHFVVSREGTGKGLGQGDSLGSSF